MGIVGRILYAIAIYIGYGIISRFSLQINTIGLQQPTRELVGNETSEYIYLLLIEDFNIDLPIILENKKNASLDRKSSEDANARKLYLDYSELAISKQEFALNSSQELRESIFMIKQKNPRKIKFLPSNGVIWRLFTWLSFRLYILCAIMFVTAIIYYVVMYYSSNCSV